MMDNRIYTFLKLCELMNYRKTAAALNMTQPSVTQHIHFLEEEYGCRLFTYNNRVLKKTKECLELERYSRSMVYNDKVFRKHLCQKEALNLSVGATKTIGDYAITDMIPSLLLRDDINLELIIDNTENLLNKLNNLELDILLVEGYIDKNAYGHKLIRREELKGICSPEHRFAGKEIPLEDLFNEHIILREDGSGTRAIFEHFLHEHGYSNENFYRKSQISSFKLISRSVAKNCGISFVYESILDNNPDIASFTLKDERIFHEFNYVFLKNTNVEQYLNLLQF